MQWLIAKIEDMSLERDIKNYYNYRKEYTKMKKLNKKGSERFCKVITLKKYNECK